MLGTKLHMSSAYHPQTDSQSKVVNRCVEQYLRCFVSQQPRKWSSFLPWAEFWYNTTYHSSIRMTAFQALYGRPPPSIPNYQVGASSMNEVDQTLQTVYRRAYQKLASRFYGPYQIEEKVGKVAYKLKLPEGSRIHPVFHVSLLKRRVGETKATITELPSLTDDGEIIMEPEAILNTRWVKKGSSFVEESLV
ncbi:hypothetical protein CK203_020887 [Vitis vinifera]|uniref:Tf2-1-like SH3-like domain-containing protein n=1 Tax=Vitis vinifera TaxID=29760 RepID=A0A438II39_VITVI|nr:hypothetical protein CK203_020887 [Vitis vinifera]